ncbi:Transcription factor IIIB 90 kDa subunit [Holothuria leucospilota]|uniref:B-related factor 1 n=1 Tax=Holothuria leucospilota TaxID=206669 RepID=A0A9Q1CG44_HOLLE|nr:Transcription factor IIIB 90 kDa subunit [Holothuria leucospilota]
MSKAAVCPNCGGSDIDSDQSRGNAVCVSCGSVIEDNYIVSEVNFSENSLGGTSVIGQFVSSEGKASSTLGGDFRTGVGKESRMITLQKGKDRVTFIGNQLNLNNHCLGIAYNFFKMAVQKKLTRGRKTDHIVAACLYLACRVECTPHMLLDLSDLLQVNVYVLGKTYVKLSQELHIFVPAIDPCLYIPRFAHKLEFGDKTHTVSMTALRLVSRMKRDWMHTGRRPSGLCGAALLVSARLHNFNRTQRQIIKVVKVCDATLRKRLSEFEDTPSGQLTVDEFNKIDLEEEQDPPSFTQARRNAKIAQLKELSQKQVMELTGEVSTVQIAIEKALQKRKQQKTDDRMSISSVSTLDEVEQEALMEELDENEILGNTLQEEENRINPDLMAAGSSSSQDRVPDPEAETGQNNELAENNLTTPSQDSAAKKPDEVLDELLMPPPWFSEKKAQKGGLRPSPLSLGLRETIEECMKIPDQSEVETQEGADDSGELDLTGIDDADLDKFILSEKEVEVKTRIWMLENAEYYKDMKKKEEAEEKARENQAKEDQKKQKRKPKKKPQAPANTAGEAIEKLLKERRISSKINYDVLKNLEKTSVEVRMSSEPSSPAEPMMRRMPPSPVTQPQAQAVIKRALVVETEDEPPLKKKAAVEALMPSVGEPAPAPSVVPDVVIESGPVEQNEEAEEAYHEEIGDYFDEDEDDDIDDYQEGYDTD